MSMNALAIFRSSTHEGSDVVFLLLASFRFT